ncbi:hypothetical protein, partial [Serratia marcescens]|uniref:hypothetical protein n=1 Tax=Serratia marcescens TaxID=615 RepID=UPI001C94302D
ICILWLDERFFIYYLLLFIIFFFVGVGVKFLVMCLMITIANIYGWANEGGMCVERSAVVMRLIMRRQVIR